MHWDSKKNRFLHPLRLLYLFRTETHSNLGRSDWANILHFDWLRCEQGLPFLNILRLNISSLLNNSEELRAIVTNPKLKHKNVWGQNFINSFCIENYSPKWD